MSDQSSRAASVRRYVFYNENRPSRAWMPTLELINERFSQHLRTTLLQHLRPGVEVTPPTTIQLIKHGDLMDRLAVPSHLTLVSFKPLRGMTLFVVDAQLVCWIVESRFGGDGRFPIAVSDREFSPFERKSTRRVVQAVVEQFALAWQPITSFEPQIVRHETNPQFAGIANSSEQIIVSAFDLRVGQGGGKLTVCIPYATLEPLHEHLVSDIVKETVDHDLRWRDTLSFDVGRAMMMLSVELAKINVTVGDLLGLRPGSVFDIDRPATVTVEANGVPLFRGHWGRYGRKVGVRIEERLQSAANVLTAERSAETRAAGDEEQ
jgi:flagellar motor switch protein FliM